MVTARSRDVAAISTMGAQSVKTGSDCCPMVPVSWALSKAVISMLSMVHVISVSNLSIPNRQVIVWVMAVSN